MSVSVGASFEQRLDGAGTPPSDRHTDILHARRLTHRGARRLAMRLTEDPFARQVILARAWPVWNVTWTLALPEAEAMPGVTREVI